LLLGALLALSILGFGLHNVAVSADDDAKVKADVDKLCAAVNAGKSVDGKAFAKSHDDLEAVMKAAFKPSKKINYEQMIAKLSKKKSYSDAEKEALTKIAKYSRAMAEVVPYYDGKTKGDAGKKAKWTKSNTDMKESATELLSALKSGDGISKAATKLNGSCTDCHGDFR
jgi:hypothetical protein